MPEEALDWSRIERLIDERVERKFDERADRRFDERIDRKLKDIGIFIGTDEALERTRRNFRKLNRDAQAEEDSGEEGIKTWWSVVGNVLGYGIAAAFGSCLTWIAQAIKGHH